MGIKKAQFLEIDAVIAIALFILGLLYIGALYLKPSELSQIQRYSADSVDYLKNTKIRDLPPDIQAQLEPGFLNPENTLAKQISVYLIKRKLLGGEGGTGDQSIDLILSHLIESIPPNLGFQIKFGTLEYNRPGKSIEDADHISTSKTMISGLAQDQYVSGKLATMKLRSAKGLVSKYLFFGGFTGQGDITYNIWLPDDADNIDFYIEGSFGGNADIYVNGNPLSCDDTTITVGSPGDFISDDSPNCAGQLGTNQDNKIEIIFDSVDFENQYIGGGYIRIRFNSESYIE